MKQLKTARGIHDILPPAYAFFQQVVSQATSWAQRFGYSPIGVPLIEPEEVFKRTLGETSDVVSKEMFCLEGRESDPEDRLVLRPEATASVVRAVLQHGLQQTLPQKLYYWGPMFRYERPQKGRSRQFHQFGVEFIGVDDPYQDVEVIAAAHSFLTALGVAQDVALQINTLGDTQSRRLFRDALLAYFKAHADVLSADSKVRLEKNPLRILDSKDQRDQELCRQAPKFEAFLSAESSAHFAKVKAGLAELNIPFVHNPCLVRGLDYYCHTAFEFVTTQLGAQGTVLAGGRYDGLSGYMGGQPIPSMGWAAGIDRLMLLLQEKGVPQPPQGAAVGILPLGPENELACLTLAKELRAHGMAVDILFKGNMGKRLKRLDKSNYTVAVMMGDEERLSSQVTVKDLKTGAQAKVPIAGLSAHIKAL